MEKEKSAVKHSPITKAAPTPPKSMPVSSIWAPLLSPSFQAIPMQHTPNKIKMCQEVNRTTHQTIVTHSRVSSKTANPQSGNMPSVNDIVECSSERSNVIKGLTIEQALTSSTSEVEER